MKPNYGSRQSGFQRQIGVIVVVLGTPLAWAGEGDLVRPVVQYAYTHDDNLFRLADDSADYGSGKSDSYQTLGAGVEVDWKYGRQEVLVNALANRTWFDKYDQLDFNGKNLNAEWQWVLGNHLKGEAGTQYASTLGTYTDIVGLVSNVRTRREHYLSANYQFHSSLFAEGRLQRLSQDYSAASQQASNFTQDKIVAGVYYRGGEVDRIGVEVSALTGDFPNRPENGTTATHYNARAIRLAANWRVTGKSRLVGQIGYLNRDDNGSGGGFSGLNGRIGWDWLPGSKTQVNLSIYKELDNTERLGADYLDVTGTQARVSWLVYPKIALGASASYEDNTYSGTPLNEDILSAGIDATYSPWVGSDLTIGLKHQARNSNVSTREFDSTALTLNAVLRF